MYKLRIASTARKASGTEIRLFALSSRVLSNHCVDAVIAGLSASTITYGFSYQPLPMNRFATFQTVLQSALSVEEV